MFFTLLSDNGFVLFEHLNDLKSSAQELNMNLVYDYKEADVVLLFLKPESGDYFSATPGLSEIEI